MDIVVFVNPMTGKIETMPAEMIAAYVVDATHLHLEEAAKVAAIRDEEAAMSLLLSMDTEYLMKEEGSGFDRLSVPIV